MKKQFEQDAQILKVSAVVATALVILGYIALGIPGAGMMSGPLIVTLLAYRDYRRSLRKLKDILEDKR